MPKEIGLLLTPENASKSIDDSKTQTRRILKLPKSTLDGWDSFNQPEAWLWLVCKPRRRVVAFKRIVQ